MTPEPPPPTTVTTLLASGPDSHDSGAVAAHAASICEQLSQRLARLVGELGVRTLFARSLFVAGARFPMLRAFSTHAGREPFEALRQCLAPEPPDVAMAAAVHVFESYTELLVRLIGAGLVASLLNEVWPTIFLAAVAKETP